MARDTLGHSARVNEYQCRAMFGDQACKAIIDFSPYFLRHDRLERRAGDFYRQISLAYVADIDNVARWFAIRGRCVIANQETGDLFDGPLRRRQTYSHEF